MTDGTANGMIPRDWAFLACRILALYFLYLSITTLLSFGFFTLAPSVGGSAPQVGYFYILHSLLQYAAALGLWIGAPRLAPRMVRQQADEAEEAAPGEWSVTQLLSLAVSVLGLVLLFLAIPDAASLGAAYVADPHIHDRDLMEIAAVATRLVLGILLVFGSRGIAKIVGWARRWQ